MKLFPIDFKSEHKDCTSAVAYRFSFRLKESNQNVREKSVRVSFRVGSPADIQAYAEMLAQDERVLSAAAEYLYSIEFDKLAKITPIKSEDSISEVN